MRKSTQRVKILVGNDEALKILLRRMSEDGTIKLIKDGRNEFTVCYNLQNRKQPFSFTREIEKSGIIANEVKDGQDVFSTDNLSSILI